MSAHTLVAGALATREAGGCSQWVTGPTQGRWPWRGHQRSVTVVLEHGEAPKVARPRLSSVMACHGLKCGLLFTQSFYCSEETFFRKENLFKLISYYIMILLFYFVKKMKKNWGNLIRCI